MEYCPAASTPSNAPTITVGACLPRKSATLEAAAWTPKDMCGAAREGRQTRAGTKPAAREIHTALTVHSTNCWTTRLQGPQPARAAARAAAAAAALETRSLA